MTEFEFPLLVGVTDMTAAEFYRALAPGLGEHAYDLGPLWEGAVERFAPICPRLELVGEKGAQTYVIHDVPVYVGKDALAAPGAAAARARWAAVREVVEVGCAADLAALGLYKAKGLLADGSFGPRVPMGCANAAPAGIRDLSGRVVVAREFERFIYYTYACFIEAVPVPGEKPVETFEDFAAFLGRDVYAVELEREGGAALGMIWPDWICHKPDAHLELGVLYAGAGERYEAFSGFAAGERCVVRLLATGCEDIELEVTLPAEPPRDFSEMFYNKQLEKGKPDHV